MSEDRDRARVLRFAQIGLEDLPRVGGKNASLGELSPHGIRVPDGFAVTAESYRGFLRHNGLEAELPGLSLNPDAVIHTTQDGARRRVIRFASWVRGTAAYGGGPDMKRRGALAAVVLVCLLGPAAHARAQEAKPQESELRETMHEIFEAVAVLLPLSLDLQRSSSPQERTTVEASLAALREASREVDLHAASRDAGFGGISQSLSRDIADAQASYARRQFADAESMIFALTSNCVACHSRLPKDRDFPLAKRLTERAEIRALRPGERVRLLVATRQFDAALALCESRFADPTIEAVDLDLDGGLLLYLVVSVRVQRDLPRARATLTRLSARTDLPLYLSRDLRAWLGQLTELAAEGAEAPALARARQLSERGRRALRFPGDRQGLIFDLAASSELVRLLEAPPQPEPMLAEAYFMLGEITARVDRLAGVSETAQDLESSIRLDPTGPFAETAYAVLEEYTLRSHGDLARVELPRDVASRLRELRELMLESEPRPPRKPIENQRQR